MPFLTNEKKADEFCGPQRTALYNNNLGYPELVFAWRDREGVGYEHFGWTISSLRFWDITRRLSEFDKARKKWDSLPSFLKDDYTFQYEIKPSQFFSCHLIPRTFKITDGHFSDGHWTNPHQAQKCVGKEQYLEGKYARTEIIFFFKK